MTLYAVSQEYLSSADAAIRNPVYVSAEILNLNAEAQASVQITATNALPSCQLNRVISVEASTFDDEATLEPDRMTASGLYNLLNVRGYVSNVLSSTTQNSAGEYPISGASVTLSFTDPGQMVDKPLTLYAPGAARITVNASYDTYPYSTFTKTYSVTNGKLVVSDLPAQEIYHTITVSVLSMNHPQWRARVRKAYFGLSEVISGNDIVSLDYTDTSDGVMLQLPQRTIRLCVNNLDGKYSQLKEYDNPTFQKWNTQATFKVGQTLEDGTTEWIPLGRFFMESYDVGKETVRFTFQSAIGLLNDFIHYWEKPAIFLNQRISDILRLDTDILDNGYKPKTAAERFAIGIDTSNAINLIRIARSTGPLATTAAHLQLIANVSGNLLRPRRTGKDLELLSIPTTAEPVRSIRADRCFDDIEWKNARDKPGTLKINLSAWDTAVHSEDIETDAILNSQDLFLVSSPGYIQENGISFVYNESEYEDRPYVAEQYVHAAYLAAGYKVDNITGVTVKANVKSAKSGGCRTLVFDQSGKEETMSNPLVYTSGDLSAEKYAARIYNELKYNIEGIMSHRGYPELDAGDIVQITSTESPIKARVIENTLTIGNGVMRGTTKAVRIS